VAVALFFIAVVVQIGGDDAGMHLVTETAHAGPKLLLHNHGFVSIVAATATVLGGYFSAQQPCFTRRVPGFAIDLSLLDPGFLARDKLALIKFRAGITQNAQLVIQPGGFVILKQTHILFLDRLEGVRASQHPDMAL
jgi:hypothetical protein